MLESIVFDFDGVIADSEPLHYEAFLSVARRFGLDFDYEEYVRRYIGFDDRDAFRAMLAKAGSHDITEVHIAHLAEEKAKTFEQCVARGIQSLPGAIGLVHAAAAAMPIAIASGATRRDIDLILGQLDIEDYFDVIISADNVPRSKPDPETYHQAVQHLAHLHPEHAIEAASCVAIEDTVAGLASARGAGLRTVGVDPSATPGGLEGADHTVRFLTDVSLDQLRRWWP